MKINYRELEEDMRRRVQEVVEQTNDRAKSCAVRSANQLRNAAMYVLKGERSGRLYRRPGSRKKYQASAPGEPPALRTGTLRRSWSIDVEIDRGWGRYTAAIYTDVPYAKLLEEGAGFTAARPYVDRIIERARPKILYIASHPL